MFYLECFVVFVVIFCRSICIGSLKLRFWYGMLVCVVSGINGLLSNGFVVVFGLCRMLIFCEGFWSMVWVLGCFGVYFG